MSELESALYPGVEKFVKKTFGCYAAGINVGLKMGRIDVVGIRDTGGDHVGRDELIAVEVKRGTQPFATCAGQTVGYSIFAEQCYLAEWRPKNPFTTDEIAIASRLGIGLIQIKSQTNMTVVLSAPTQTPIERLKTQLCDKLGYGKCTVCQSLFVRGTTPKKYDKVVRQSANTSKALVRAVELEKGLVYWLHHSHEMVNGETGSTVYRRRFVCPDCVASLFAHLKPNP